MKKAKNLAQHHGISACDVHEIAVVLCVGQNCCDSRGQGFLCRTDCGFLAVREVRRGGHLSSQSAHNPFRGGNRCNMCRRQGKWEPIKLSTRKNGHL